MHFKAEFINSDTPVKKLFKNMKQNKCAHFFDILCLYDSKSQPCLWKAFCILQWV